MDVPDYQATSNSWTFLEVNVGIICACELLSSFQLFSFQDIHNQSHMSTPRPSSYQPPTFDQITHLQVMLTLINRSPCPKNAHQEVAVSRQE